jgi:hypothetical protein
MGKVAEVAKRRWKAILLMTVLFLLGIGIGASGGESTPEHDVENAAATLAKTITVDGEPVTVTETETQTRTVKRRVVKTVTEAVAAKSGGGGGGGGGGRSCHPSYKGACLSPTASDYDCGGGSGDGPKYVYGTVRVVGYDEYDLDSNGDGPVLIRSEHDGPDLGGPTTWCGGDQPKAPSGGSHPQRAPRCASRDEHTSHISSPDFSVGFGVVPRWRTVRYLRRARNGPPGP